MGKTFAERLVQARRRRGLSQAELARLVNLRPSSIGNFEQLSPPQLSAVRAMVDAFTSVELEKPKIRSTV